MSTQYVYDGWNEVQEQNSKGAVSANMLNGLGLDDRFTRTAIASGTTSAFLVDGVGSTLGLAYTGAVKTDYAYQPYGTASVSGTSNTNTYEYTGRELDGSGLQYNRNRYYNPAWGRFVSEDPIGFAGGINVYAYVGDAPSEFTDPLGHAAFAMLGGDEITVDVQISLQGPNENAALASAWQGAINEIWNKGNWKFVRCTVKFNVTVQVGGNADNNITVGPAGVNGRSFVNGVGGNTGTWFADGGNWVPAHETGHLLGEADEYTDTTLPSGQIASIPNSGWSGNIMGQYNGNVEQRNIDELVMSFFGPNAAKCKCGK